MEKVKYLHAFKTLQNKNLTQEFAHKKGLCGEKSLLHNQYVSCLGFNIFTLTHSHKHAHTFTHTHTHTHLCRKQHQLKGPTQLRHRSTGQGDHGSRGEHQGIQQGLVVSQALHERLALERERERKR